MAVKVWAIDLGFPGFHHFSRVKKSTVILICSSHLFRGIQVIRGNKSIHSTSPGLDEGRVGQIQGFKAVKSGSQVITAVKSIEGFDQVCHIKQHSNESGHPATGAEDKVSMAVKSSSFIQLPNWQRHQRVVQGPGSPRAFRL